MSLSMCHEQFPHHAQFYAEGRPNSQKEHCILEDRIIFIAKVSRMSGKRQRFSTLKLNYMVYDSHCEYVQ